MIIHNFNLIQFKKFAGQILKAKQGFSLLETLITLIVVAIIIVMLSNVLSIALRVSVLTSERAHAKNEMNNLLQKLDRDVSNAEFVFIPDPDVIPDPDDSDEVLIIETAQYRVRWAPCDNDNATLAAGAGANGSLCQTYCAIDPANPLDIDTCTGTSKLNYISSNKVLLEDFLVIEIESAITGGLGNERIKSAVVTIKARHTNETLNINNLYKQITISSNNFII